MTALPIRKLGNTGMTPRALGLGCAWFGSDKSSDRDASEGVRRAIELGIDFLDTSPLYGESERRVGLALEGGWRDRVYLQTKVGTHPQRRYDFSAEATRWSVENSLRLLKTGYLDSVLIHDPQDIEDPLAPGRCLDELLKMKEEGLIGHLGIGVRSHDFHRRAMETGHVEIVLTYLDYTLLDQSVASTTLPLARERGVGIILASIHAMGLLTGAEPDEEIERRRNPGRQPLARRMWLWCREYQVNIRHLAVQFCLAAPIDGIVMAGPSNKKEVEEAYESATAQVPVETWRAFKAEFGVGP
jgi:aryl-alcohol dehydrogenase-like predicted oxidoreductase